VAVCQAELATERKIEWTYIRKCLEVYDLHLQGHSPEDIADILDLNHYKSDEVMKEGLDSYLKEWGIPQVKRCLKDAKEIIQKGSII
jgi:hypothetical protein